MNRGKLKTAISEHWNELRSIRSKEDVLAYTVKVEKTSKAFFSSIEMDSMKKNVGIAIPRILFGVALLSDFWRLKMGMPVNEIQSMLPADFVLPDWLSWLDQEKLNMLDQLEYGLQGGLLIIGFNTRLMALSFIWTVTAGLFALEGLDFGSIPLMVPFLLVCTYSLILGSGKLGIDHLIYTKFSKWKNSR